MITRTVYGPLPDLTLAHDQLKDLVAKLLSGYLIFDFSPFTNHLAEHINANGIGLQLDKQTIHTGGLSQRDTARVREIIWDFIIDRYITPGGNGHNTWPTLTITEREKVYFSE